MYRPPLISTICNKAEESSFIRQSFCRKMHDKRDESLFSFLSLSVCLSRNGDLLELFGIIAETNEEKLLPKFCTTFLIIYNLDIFHVCDNSISRYICLDYYRALTEDFKCNSKFANQVYLAPRSQLYTLHLKHWELALLSACFTLRLSHIRGVSAKLHREKERVKYQSSP